MADWDNIHKMFADIMRFARDNPSHRFVWADDRNAMTLGVVAFIEDPRDEQAQEWRIPMYAVKNTQHNAPTEIADILARALQSHEGKLRMLESAVSTARQALPRRSRYERLMQDDDL